MTRYYWADPHFFHGNILQYTDRPWKDISSMHNGLIKNYNEVVGVDDTCYWIGDAGFFRQASQIGAILNKLNGKKVLILGNHDEYDPFTYVRQGFWSVHTSLEVPGTEFVLSHDPSVYCLVPKDRILLFGHVHNACKTLQNNAVNVGVDMWDYKPVSETQIYQTLKELRDAEDDWK